MTSEFDLQDGLDNNKVLYCQLRLLFTCSFRPTRGQDRKIRPLTLALITTFEDFPMQHPGLVAKAEKVNRILYEPTPVPCVYVVPVENILCRALCFRATSTETSTTRFHAHGLRSVRPKPKRG